MEPLKNVTARVRADIRAAAKAGTLPEHPAGITFSVRMETYSQGSSVNVYIKGAPDEWTYFETGDGTWGPRKVASEPVKALANKLHEIVESHRGDRRFFSAVYTEEGLVLACHLPR
ncbi:hypothetical protein ACFY05_31785 [Microtetraspora fusca]|uniref:Uncharacterized protein n=1 Tax=Microtetraspora fusca TaxID=1997 RepID=A0ABW6VDR1_MICFU